MLTALSFVDRPTYDTVQDAVRGLLTTTAQAPEKELAAICYLLLQRGVPPTRRAICKTARNIALDIQHWRACEWRVESDVRAGATPAPEEIEGRERLRSLERAIDLPYGALREGPLDRSDVYDLWQIGTTRLITARPCWFSFREGAPANSAHFGTVKEKAQAQRWARCGRGV